jgi:large subunit ribosomal protein L5e
VGFVKVLKNKAYSKRYQTKFRRRRQGKTDYYARKRLVVNDKDKYDTKKYRMVVRFTNKRVLASIVYSTLKGDMTICAADSKELTNWGVKCGLTNYAASYATGLLLARRLLQDKKIDDTFKGNSKIDGSLYNITNENPERRPFKAYLDVGLVRTTTGNRVFGAMKGACDGGLNVPHNEKRFPGFRWEKPEAGGRKKGGAGDEKEKPVAKFTADEHREHIFGIHVQEYYDLLKGENPAAFKKQFSKWEKALGGKSFEDIYKTAHAGIRKSPARTKVARKNAPVRKIIQAAPTLIQQNSKGKKWLRQKKITIQLRKERIQEKVQKIMKEL